MRKRRQNRKRGKIDKLPQSIREAVDMMVQNPAEYTYRDIVDFIRDNGFEVSPSSVARYAAGLNAKLEDVMLISESFRAINDELQKYPEIDTTEALCRVTAYKMLEAVQAMSPEQLKESDPLKLVNNVAPLVRALSYKSDMAQKGRDLKDTAYEVFKEDIFDDMRKSDPELYARLSAYIKKNGGSGECT